MGVSKPNRAASYTAQVRSGKEADVGTGPESHGRGNVFLGGCGERRRSLEDGGQQRGRVGGGGLVGAEESWQTAVRTARSSALA